MILIPKDPLAKPPKERCQAAFDRLCALRPEGGEPELQIYDAPEFVWTVEEAESVFCPFCGADIDSWFYDALDRWEEGDRNSLATTTPCCAQPTTLNDLDFGGTQGFACVTMELLRPGDDLEPFERKEIEALLGVPVRVIWRHI